MSKRGADRGTGEGVRQGLTGYSMHSPVERVLEQLTLVVGGRREGDSLRPDRLPHPSSHRPKLARWLCVIWYRATKSSEIGAPFRLPACGS